MRAHTAALECSTLYGANVNPATIFGSILADWFEADLGVSVSGGNVVSISGGKLGTVLTQVSAQRPPTGVDGVYFNGRNVIKCSSTGNKFLHRVGGGSLVPAGSRPYMAVLYRWTVTSGLTPFNIWNSAITIDTLRGTHAGGTSYLCSVNQTDVQTYGSFSTSTLVANAFIPHLMELYWGANSALWAAFDGAADFSVIGGLGGPTPRAIDSVGIGRADALASALGSNVNFAASAFTNGLPTAAMRAALRASWKQTWGGP